MTPLPWEATDVTCTACGCLCDDIVFQHTGVDWRTSKACPHGDAWFRTAAEGPAVEALIGDRPASLDHALAEAGRLLADARLPLICCLDDLDVDGIRAAVALADEFGACLDTSAASTADEFLFPGIGDAGCTWGEVRDRADLIVYWNCDPAFTHHRHEELIRGPAKQARPVREVSVNTSDTYAAAWTIRLATRRDRWSGEWRELVEAVQHARYGVIIHDHTSPAIALRALVTDLNRRTRFRRMDLGRPGNAAGERAVIRWLTGYHGGVGFHSGSPRAIGTEFSSELLLSRGHVDAVVTASANHEFSEAAQRNLDKLPHIAILSQPPQSPRLARIALFSKTPGIHDGGAVFRTDGVVLPLRPVFPSSFPSADMVIKRLAAVVRKQRATKDG